MAVPQFYSGFESLAGEHRCDDGVQPWTLLQWAAVGQGPETAAAERTFTLRWKHTSRRKSGWAHLKDDASTLLILH